MKIVFELLLPILLFIWGSIPFGFILTKIYTGKNIQMFGSGNIGSTNVYRVAGKKTSICTQLLDMLKGLLPVAVFLYLNKRYIYLPNTYVYIIALSSIIGHDFSIFLNFKGGKGVNTTLGSSLLLAPIPVLISVIIYFLTKWKFRYISLSSILLATSLPITAFLFYGLDSEFYYLSICSILIIIRHFENIQRLLHKKELL